MTPASNDLFTIKDSSELSDEYAEYFHSMTARLLYLSKRTRPDLLLAVTFLTTRVVKPTEEDLEKLNRVLKYIHGTTNLKLNLNIGQNFDLAAYVDASFATHSNYKSHTGALIKLGDSAIFTKSTKQKLTAKSSTEAELVGASESVPQLLWFVQFLEQQGYSNVRTLLFQDNMSTIHMLNKGRPINEATRHINIRYFFVHDKIIKGEIELQHMPTDLMVADIFTKPIQGKKFIELINKLLN